MILQGNLKVVPFLQSCGDGTFRRGNCLHLSGVCHTVGERGLATGEGEVEAGGLTARKEQEKIPENQCFVQILVQSVYKIKCINKNGNYY